MAALIRSASGQRHGGHGPAVTENGYHTGTNGVAYAVRAELQRSKEEIWGNQVRPRVEVGSNTSTVALRVVGGDEKGTQCMEVLLGHPVPVGYR
jgi:hypothetical protein